MLDLIRQRAQSWGVKIAFGIIILVFVFWGVGSYTDTGPSVAATVNGKPILLHEFVNIVRAKENEVRAKVPDFSQEDMRTLRIPEQTLQIMVSRMLVEGEATRLGITVTPLELLHALSVVPSFQGPDGKFDQAVYEKALEDQGRNVAEFETEVMRDMLMDKMRVYVSSAVTVTPEEARRRFAFQMEKRTISYVLFSTEKYRDGIAVSDESVKSYYDTRQAQFAEPAMVAVRYIDVKPSTLAPAMDIADNEIHAAYQRGPLRYNLRQIILTVPADADEAKEAEVKSKLEGIAKEIHGGKPFVDVAKEKSEGPAAESGGEIGWVTARQLPANILGALAGLKKGAVSAPVRVGMGYAIMQLVESDPDWSLTEAEIKAALRESVALDKAAVAFRDVQGQAEDLVALAKPLDVIAKELKVEPHNSNLAPLEDLAFVLGLRKAGQMSLFTGEKGSLVSAILETREGFIIAEIAEQKKAGVKPLDDVRPLIVDILTRREAEKKAEEVARAAMKEFANGVPTAYKALVTTSEAFTRQGEISGIGFSPALTEAVFSSPLNVWLKEPYATTKGAVIAMPLEVIPLNDVEWAEMQNRVVPGLLEAKQNQVFTAFIADLGKDAKISVPNPAIFE